MAKKEYLVYVEDRYIGKHNFSGVKNIRKWMKERNLGNMYLYTGVHYYNYERISVAVITKKKWDDNEKQRRKRNGLLYIREYYIPKNE